MAGPKTRAGRTREPDGRSARAPRPAIRAATRSYLRDRALTALAPRWAAQRGVSRERFVEPHERLVRAPPCRGQPPERLRDGPEIHARVEADGVELGERRELRLEGSRRPTKRVSQPSSTATSAANTRPRPRTVLIWSCCWPSSPIARRASFVTRRGAASVTCAPRQTSRRKTSSATTRERCCSSTSRRPSTSGWTGTLTCAGQRATLAIDDAIAPAKPHCPEFGTPGRTRESGPGSLHGIAPQVPAVPAVQVSGQVGHFGPGALVFRSRHWSRSPFEMKSPVSSRS